MNKFMRSQNWISVVVAIVIIVTLAVIGFATMRVINQQSNDQTATPQTTEQAPEVNDSSDLKEAEDYVKNTDIDGKLDTSEIDSTLKD